MPSHIWRLFTGESDCRPGNSLDSVIIAFIGLFPICLSRYCWFFFIQGKCHNTCILYFNFSLDEGAMNVHSPLLNLRLKTHKVFFKRGPIFSPHRCKMYWHENQKVKFLFPYIKINNYFDSINNQAPLLERIAWTSRSEGSHKEMACTG